MLETLDGKFTGPHPLERYYERAYELLASTPLRDALDITQESPGTREQYGFGDAAASAGAVGYAHKMRGQNLLLARRLVEAGVPFVTVYDYKQQGRNWDAHAQCASQHKSILLPPADRGLAALIQDLETRGLLESTLVVALGEFGRTPHINSNGGRDHWPDCYSVVLAGGGVRGGAVHGSSDALGAYPAADPVSPADLTATILWRFGIDPAGDMHDRLGRPYPLSAGQPIASLFA